MKQGIAVAGSILVDKINVIDSYPSLGKLVQIRDTENSVGGLVPNVGMDLKSISPDLPVVALGRVGKDDDGAYVLSKMQEKGVDVSGVVQDEELKTSFTSVMSIPGAERTFFTYAGASSRFGFEDIDFDRLNVRMFHLGYFLLLDKVDGGDGLRILQELKKRGVSTSIDLVSEESNRYRQVIPCLPCVDNLIVNELEAAGLTGWKDVEDLEGMCRKLQSLGVKERVIIHKKDCGVCLQGDTFIKVPSIGIPKSWIKGKTGAGDAFTAGCLTAIYEGASAAETLDFGGRCAAISLTEENAVDGMKTKREIYQITKGY